MIVDLKDSFGRRSGFRVWIAYWLWRLGLQRILPRAVINRVPVVECDEPFVLVYESSRLRLRDGSGSAFRVREGVAKRLYAAAELLPDDFTLILVEGYRSLERQQMLWDAELASTKSLHPRIDRAEAERLTRLRIADPTSSGGGHQVGAAVDVTLANADGTELSMGTAVCGFSELTPTHADAGMFQSVRKRRRLLCRVMRQAGFVNYPGEWWHFSYGDKMWAAYGRKRRAIYGPRESFCGCRRL